MISSTLLLCCSNDSQRCWMPPNRTQIIAVNGIKVKCNLQKTEAAALEAKTPPAAPSAGFFGFLQFTANAVQQVTLSAC